jgi:PKD repeat protein
MNRTLRLVALLVGIVTIGGAPAAAQVIDTFPHVEDFETTPSAYSECLAPCPVPPGWINDTTDTAEWCVGAGGTWTPGTGPSSDASPGLDNERFIYVESSGPCAPHKTANLITPPIDASMGPLVASFFFHIHGTTTGSLHVDLSTDDGLTWNDDFIPPRATVHPYDWQRVHFPLHSSDSATTRLRIRAVTGSGESSDLAIDEFVVSAALPVDAGITGIDLPHTLACDGPDEIDVAVSLTNFGSEDLTDVEIRWENTSDGGLEHTLPWTGLLAPGETASGIVLGTVDVSSGHVQVDALTAQPNGIQEPYAGEANDGLSAVTNRPLEGTYTIRGSDPYWIESFAYALELLGWLGICGPVEFVVVPGEYEEWLIAGPVDGVSSTNTVTFRPVEGATNPVVLTPPDTFLYADVPTLSLIGTTGFRFVDLVLRTADDDAEPIVHMREGTGDNRFESCVFESYSDDVRALVVSDGPNSGNRFVSNHFVGGDNGLHLTGWPSAPQVNTLVQGNSFQGQRENGANLDYQQSLLFHGNEFVDTAGADSGFLLSNLSGTTAVTNNEVRSDAELSTGLYAACDPDTDLNHLSIANNAITISSSSSYFTGGILAWCFLGHLRVHHNSVAVLPMWASPYGGALRLFLETGSSSEILNNLLVAGSNAPAVAVNDFGLPAYMNFNNLVSETNLVYTNGTPYPDLAAWQATGHDLNSLSVDPEFLADDDLHVCAAALDGAGIPVPTVTHDFDGEPRDPVAPDIGADEFAYLEAAFTASTSGLEASFTNRSAAATSFAWDFGDGATSTSAEPVHTYASPGTYGVTLTASGPCGTSDVTDTVVIDPGPSMLSVSTTGAGSGGVTSDPAGIDCGATCSHAFSWGTVVQVFAVPDAGSTFMGWGGDSDCHDGTVTMIEALSCEARFEPTSVFTDGFETGTTEMWSER